jgi:hypothetical protein
MENFGGMTMLRIVIWEDYQEKLKWFLNAIRYTLEEIEEKIFTQVFSCD